MGECGMRILQLAEHLSLGDGIGNHTILTHRLLERAGYHVETYAGGVGEHISPKLVKPFREDLQVEPEDILMLQFGLRGRIAELIDGYACRKILVYHNITRPEFLLKYDYTAYKETKSSYELVRKWAYDQTFDAVIALSQFSVNELIEMGYDPERIFLFPGCLFPFQEYSGVPDSDTLEDYGDGVTNVLFVGRIAPHKKQHDIVKAFAYYQEHMEYNARLIFVGSGEDSSYGRTLKKYIQELHVRNVIFPGHISNEALIALYQCASVFLCMSEHEGFCTPLIEAMLFRVPIIAYRAAAIPDTLGNSAVLLDVKNPILTAKWIERIVKDDSLREKIVSAQQKRLQDFDQTYLGEKMLNYIKSFVQENIVNHKSVDMSGMREEDVGKEIDGALYRLMTKKLSDQGEQMSLSEREYLRFVRS